MLEEIDENDQHYNFITQLQLYYKNEWLRDSVIEELERFKDKIKRLRQKLTGDLKLIEFMPGFLPYLGAKSQLEKLENELKEWQEKQPPKPKVHDPSDSVKNFHQRKRKPIKRSFISNKPTNQKEEEKYNKEDLSAEEVLQMTFDTYTLQGELGRFLGELDHNKVAFALTGDSGAGKSYFS